MRKSDTPAIAARSDLPSANEDVAKLRLELLHRSLKELEEAGLVRLDRQEQTVKKGPKFNDEKTRIRLYEEELY
ncbi:hypothetical protein [Haloarcula sp. Atlit-7R]|uniref:hypothetical protein n=1 Tax=Haloarcula sp. Atlit-7R TaxID=2282125 RepID=UPI000EF1670F|nr:hypothetical protein [Haloarcula sp. Atlit-7R]RLM88208.1 hypothetical protein D3D01_21870 [Haloarcula sp. Atlit-7R]